MKREDLARQDLELAAQAQVVEFRRRALDDRIEDASRLLAARASASVLALANERTREASNQYELALSLYFTISESHRTRRAALARTASIVPSSRRRVGS